MPNDKFDFGKQYFILAKKLDNHIKAQSNPHSINKEKVGLGNIENFPLDTELDTHSEHYINNKAVAKEVEKIYEELDTKQETVEVNAEQEIEQTLNNIKINDVVYGFRGFTVDPEIDSESHNPVENRTIYNALQKTCKVMYSFSVKWKELTEPKIDTDLNLDLFDNQVGNSIYVKFELDSKICSEFLHREIKTNKKFRTLGIATLDTVIGNDYWIYINAGFIEGYFMYKSNDEEFIIYNNELGYIDIVE